MRKAGCRVVLAAGVFGTQALSSSVTLRVSGCVFAWRGAARMQFVGPGAGACRKPLLLISKQHFPKGKNLCSEIKIISSKAGRSELDCSSSSGRDAVNLAVVSKAAALGPPQDQRLAARRHLSPQTRRPSVLLTPHLLHLSPHCGNSEAVEISDRFKNNCTKEVPLYDIDKGT